MRVMLLRHGNAVSYNDAPYDEARWLTPAGREGVRAVGDELARRGVRFTRAFTSPLVRAVQTTEVLLTAMAQGHDVSVEVAFGLAAEQGTTAQALMPLDRAGDDDTFLLVTHMPKVSSLAAFLTGQRNYAGFPTSGACLIEWPTGVRPGEKPGKVLLRIDPGQLR